MRFIALFLCMIFASKAYAASTCEMSSIAGCTNTNQLVWAKSFEPALRSFLDKKKVAWLGQRQDVAEAVQEVLSGAPDDVVKVMNGLLRFSAVRHQSATERGAIFISTDGKIEAIGVLHFNCEHRCEKTYSLSTLLKHKDARLASLVQAWGDEQMKINKERGLEENLTAIGHFEVLTRKH